MLQDDFSEYNGEGTKLRKVQLRLLDILVEIDKVCRRHNIDYWLDSGTLLGAVRHGGFIPWDDDVDICVCRKDYKRLRSVLMSELPEYLVFADWKTDENFFDKCGRVIDRRSRYNHPMLRFQKEKGLVVDIIIVEKTLPWIKKIVDPVYGPIFRQVHNFGKPLYKSNFKRLFNKSISTVLYPLALALLYLGRSVSLVSRSSVFMHTYGSMFKSVRFEKDIFPLSEVMFEGKIFLAPRNTDSYLKNVYGNYMILPPIDKRVSHEGVNYYISDSVICE